MVAITTELATEAPLLCRILATFCWDAGLVADDVESCKTAPEFCVFEDCLDGYLVKLNILVRSFPNWRAREMLRVAILLAAALDALVFRLFLLLPEDAPVS